MDDTETPRFKVLMERQANSSYDAVLVLKGFHTFSDLQDAVDQNKVKWEIIPSQWPQATSVVIANRINESNIPGH